MTTVDADPTKLTSKALSEFNPADYDVSLMVNESFMKNCGQGINISESP